VKRPTSASTQADASHRPQVPEEAEGVTDGKDMLGTSVEREIAQLAIKEAENHNVSEPIHGSLMAITCELQPRGGTSTFDEECMNPNSAGGTAYVLHTYDTIRALEVVRNALGCRRCKKNARGCEKCRPQALVALVCLQHFEEDTYVFTRCIIFLVKGALTF
jgi:hypothetical protein